MLRDLLIPAPWRRPRGPARPARHRPAPVCLASAIVVVFACSRPAPDDPESPADEPADVGHDTQPADEDAAVLIIAIDGLRPADAARADTPNLDRLADEGAFTGEAEAVMPTITRTNFVSFATGGFADEHGVVGNQFKTDDWEERVTDGPTLEEAQASVPVPTIFEVAEEHGLRAGMFAMKGYELVGARGATVQLGGGEVFPDEIWDDRYNPQDGGSVEEAVSRRLRKNEVLVDVLAESLETQPLDLILINLGATDYIAHQQGPESEHYIHAIEKTDALLPRVLELARAANPDRAWHVLVGTDHGFSATDRDQLVVPHLEGIFEVEALDEAGIEHRIYQRGGRAAELYVRDDADAAAAAELLQDRPWVRAIYTDADVDGRAGDYDDLRVGYEGRRGAVYVITDPDYAFAFPNAGQHGSDEPKDRTIPMWLWGEAIDGTSADLDGATNADIGPTALTILGIEPDEALETSGRSLLTP